MGIASPALSAGPISFEPVGSHFPIFRFEKSVHPENVLVVYVKTSKSCDFIGDKDFVNFYWLMNGSSYKRVNSLIESRIRAHLSLIAATHGSFKMKLTDPDELKSDLKSVEIEVKATAGPGSCEIKTIAHLKSSVPTDIYLDVVRSVTAPTWLPPFHRLVSVTITGRDPVKGQIISKTFSSKSSD